MKWFKCIHCGIEKEETFFYVDRSKKNGHKPRCKDCDLLSRDKSKRAEYEKKYWSTKRDKRRKQVLDSQSKNKEHHKEQRKEYLKTDTGIAMYKRQTQTRYAIKKNAFIEKVNPIDKYREQCGVCYICNNKFEFSQMELDHVVPLSRGGKHSNENTKMACSRCNRSKGAKLIEEVCHQMV